MNVVIIGMYNQQKLLGFENVVWSQLTPMFLACTVVTITAIGKPGAGIGFGEVVVLHSWIHCPKPKSTGLSCLMTQHQACGDPAAHMQGQGLDPAQCGWGSQAHSHSQVASMGISSSIRGSLSITDPRATNLGHVPMPRPPEMVVRQ